MYYVKYNTLKYAINIVQCNLTAYLINSNKLHKKTEKRPPKCTLI